MTQRDNKSRTLYVKSSWTPRLSIARRAVFLMARKKLLWSKSALAMNVSASSPGTRHGNGATFNFGACEIATQ
jgi:hypothetical protein